MGNCDTSCCLFERCYPNRFLVVVGEDQRLERYASNDFRIMNRILMEGRIDILFCFCDNANLHYAFVN